MPIVQAYKGHILVEGQAKGITYPTDKDKAIYSKKLTAYGETLGELLDNLVQASVTLANDAFQWAMMTQSSDYTPNDDHWFCSIVHPEITRRTDWPVEDVGSGSSIHDFDYIVRHAVVVRDITIRSTATHLLLAKSGPSAISEKPKTPYNGISNATSFQEMTGYGFQGPELDEILRIAKEEGRLNLPAEKNLNAKAKPKWWSFSK